jgi:formate hydrogenlyase transcriptional activator
MMIAHMASAEQHPESLNIQLLVDSIPALIHTAKPDGHLDYFNKPWLDYLGAALDEVAGWKWTAFVHPEDVDGIVAHWRACIANGEIFEYEARVRRANGEFRWMFHRKVPLHDANGNIVKWYGSSFDIEDRKKAEVLLSAEKRLLEMTATDVTLERILNDLCLFIEEQRSGTLASVLLLNPDGVYLRFAAGPGIPNEWKQQMEKLPIGPCAGSCGTAAFTRSPVIVSDIATDPLWEVPEHRASALKHGLRASWSSPVLSSKGKVLGTFCMYYREPRSPEAQDMELIEAATHLVEVALERDRARQDLERSEAYLTEAQRLSHTGSFGWKPDSGEIIWSDETYRIFEYDPAEKPTLNMVLRRIHPQDRALAQQLIEDVSKSCTDFEQEYRLLPPDGRVKHVHAIAHAAQNVSGDRELVGAVTDVTERKATEEDLRSSEGYLAEAQKMSQTGSWAWSAATGGPSYWSEECYRVLGFDPTDGLPQGEDFFQQVHPDDRPGFRELAETSIREKAEFEADYRVVHPDGGVKDIHAISHPVLSTSGELVEFVGTVIDVTERKRAEEELRRSEMELRDIVDIVPQLIAVYGPNRERLYANRTALDYLGISLNEWRLKPFAASAHPDDSDRLKAYTDHALSSGSADELELRLHKHDGSYRWFLARFNPLRDEQGRIIRWYYTGTDIDDRKKAEDRLRRENVALREEIDKTSMFEEIVGTSPALQAVLSRISKVAPSNSTVLITGETGTGKELVARAIHRRSNRNARVFVSVNCAAIPRDLIASELFGHEKGAFTGATQQRLGRFELANGGTLFLDEVGELPAETQIALLRVLQEHEFERVGGMRPIRADVRVIAATNRDLQAAIRARSFRSDLYYRLNVFPIEIPALRERKEDIRLLLEYFIDRFARNAGENITTVDKKTLRLLESYPWPGNIRELQNVIERSVIVCETSNFSVDESWLSRQPPETKTETHLYLSEKVAAQEKEMIEAALRECQGRVYGPRGAAAKRALLWNRRSERSRSTRIASGLSRKCRNTRLVFGHGATP